MTFLEITKKDKQIVRFRIDFKFARRIASRHWFLHGDRCATYYEGKETELSHFLVGRPPKGFVVRHHNGNKTDCRRRNLRIVPWSYINFIKKVQANNSTGFRGIHRYKNGDIVANHGRNKFFCKSVRQAKKIRKTYNNKMNKYALARNQGIPMETLEATIEQEYVRDLHAAMYA
jgi:hypothetical protein